MSNPVIETINSRRSTRAYEPTPIPRDIINTIIEAGNLAPSRGRMEEGEILFQPWRFVVVENPEFKQRLVQTTNPIWKQSVERIKEMKPETYETAMNLYNAMDEPKDMVYYCAPVILSRLRCELCTCLREHHACRTFSRSWQLLCRIWFNGQRRC
jgi:nitroreductase